MRRIFFCRPFVLGVVLACSLSLFAPPIHAYWDTRSGQRPGIGSFPVAALVAVAAGASLVVKFARRGPDVRAIPGRLEFRRAAVDTITLLNTGKQRVSIVGLELSAGEAFSLQPLSAELPVTLAPGQSLTIGVTFTPRAGGRFTDELAVTTRGDGGNKTNRLRVGITAAATTETAALAAIPEPLP